jgi:uncharacterized repeat protein (TIGR01451 family)/fimbrial isopeptide formation D2 family protein
MGVEKAWRSRRLVAVSIGALFLALLALVTLARADGSPDISASISSSSTLYGDPVHVTVSTANPLGPSYGYNLTYRVVLPAGVSYAAGGEVTPKEIAEAPGTGETTLIFENISDLSPGSTKTFSFDLSYSEAVYDAGDSFPVKAQAFVNDDPRFIPKFNAEGIPQGPESSSFTGYTPELTGIQTLKAIEVEIEEPSAEGEILRGVHEHQTVYTLKVTNNGVNPTTGTKLDAYIPAGLEFLGCGGPGADHTTEAPTSPGSDEEWPGSGPIVVEPLAGCVSPELVKTEFVDPDGPSGPMPEAVYTHVVFPVGELEDGETKTFPYRAAVPLRANEDDFPGTVDDIGQQATNLDNNSGPEVIDETLLRTYAKASGTYQGKTPTAASDEQILDRTAEDWVVRKSASSGTLAQKQITTWKLTFETSEYKFVDDAVVTDTLPDGLCPLGPENFTSENDEPDDECDPVVGQEPSAAYASVEENEDGSWTLTWDKDSLGTKLGHTGISDKFEITFPTKTRTHYQEDEEPTTPILSHDQIDNTVTTEGSGLARCTASGTPDCSTPGPKIYGSDGPTIEDASHAEQVAGAPLIKKEIAESGGSGSDCQEAGYTNGVPHYHPGDRVCWLVRVDFPGTLDTSAEALADFLPESTEYEATSDEAGPSNNVETEINETNAGEGLLTWTITGSTVPAGGEIFERYIATIVKPLGEPVSGDLTGNLFKFASENTEDETFPQRDEAQYVLDTPEVDLVKGVEEVVRGGSAVDGPNDKNVDHKQVQAGDEVTYRVDVSNEGLQDAVNVEVWDQLPPEYDCAAVTPNDGGTCVDAAPNDRIVWTIPKVAAETESKLTYTVTVPADIGPGRTLVNEAGVRQFQGETNIGGFYDYTPAGNIDPENATTPNAAAADDPSDVFTAAASVAKAQATSVNEGGNNLATQATIGEQIEYTITATIPEGTTLGGVAELTDAFNDNERQAYVPGSATATLNGGELPAEITLDATGVTPRIVFPANYSNAAGSSNDIVVLKFKALVTDVAANHRTSGNLTDQADLSWADPNIGSKSTVSSNTTSTQIVEPLISQAKADDANPSPVDPGDVVTYTVTTSNSNATRVSTAHDLKVVDKVPLGLTPVGAAPGNEPLADGAEIPGSGGAIWDADTRTISKTVATLAPNASTAIVYRAKVDKPAVAGASLTNKAEATTASLSEAFAGRRTSGTGYKATSEDTVRIGGASIAKTASPEKATIGETVTYNLTVTIPPNVELYDTTVYDTLPWQLEFQEFVSETCESGCSPATPIHRYPVAMTDETFLAWDLGDIPALGEQRVVKLTYRAYVRDVNPFFPELKVESGQKVDNRALIASNRTDKRNYEEFVIPSSSEFDDKVGPVKATVTVDEPKLSIAKEIKVGSGAFGPGPATAHSDDTLTYRLTVTNSGSAAYDVEVTDQIDPALTEVQPEAQAGVTVTDGWSEADPDLAWRIDTIPTEGSVTLTYTAKFVAASQLHDNQEVPNTAKVPHYFAVPKATRVANPSHTYRNYEDGGEDSVKAVLDFPHLELEKTTGLSGNPDTGLAEINQDFPWRIVVTNSSPTAGAKGIHVHDVLPLNWKYKSGSTTLTPGGALEPSVTPISGGEQLEWVVPALGPEQSVEIAFQATPALAAAGNPGLGDEAHVNRAAVLLAEDEAGNPGNEEGLYGTESDEATATLEVPQLEIEKTPDGGGAVAGMPSSFTIEVSNEGDGVARNVSVEDVLPAGLSYAVGTATAQPESGFSETGVNPGPGTGETTIEWAIAQIPAHSSVQIELPVKVAAEVGDGTTLTNTAAAASDEETTPVEDEGSLNVETEADMAIEKTGEPGYTAGENYTWHLRVRNLGPSNAENVVVADPLPAGTTFVSSTAPCAHASGEVKCELGDQPPSFDQTYDVTVKVDPGTTTSPLSNTATVDTDTDDPEPGNDESTFGPTAGSLADVWVEKSVDPEAILRKAQTTFTLVVGNDGPSTARNVELDDPLPAGLEFVSTDEPPCSHTGNLVECAFGDMAPGDEETVQITVKDVVNGEHDNVATVSTTTSEPPGGGEPNSDEASVIVGPVADLALEKTGPATVAADGQLTWTLKATNNGEDPATGVTITDPLPAGTVFFSADAGCAFASGVVNCAIGNLAVGESAERQVTVTVPRALADTTVVNSATVDGDQGDDEPGNDSDEATTQVGPSADVSIVKTGPARVNANGTMTWTLAVGNAGPSTATGVSVKDTLPAGVELISATPTQGSCAGAVECQLGTLPKGGAAQVQLVVHVPPALEGSSLLNSASVTAEEPDPVPENNESKATTIVDPPAPSDYDLAISKTVDGSSKVNFGDTVSYEIAVSNRGPATATGVKIVDALPASLEYVKASIPGGKCTLNGAVITCKIASLAAGAEVWAKVTVRVMAEGTVKNTATVSAAVADADPNNNTSSAKVSSSLGKTKLKVKKTRLGKGEVEAGDRIKYKIRVANRGAGIAANVVVCDRLPSKLSFASLSGASLERGDACWKIDMLAGGASRTFRLAARVDGGVGGGMVRNLAYLLAENAPRSQGVAGVRVKSAGPGRAGGVTG